MNLGTLQAQGAQPLGAPPRRIEADVIDVVTIGFRADGRLVVLTARPNKAELFDYRRDGRRKSLATYPGARVIACEDTVEQMVWSIDGRAVFTMPKGRDQWSLYRA